MRSVVWMASNACCHVMCDMPGRWRGSYERTGAQSEVGG